MATRIYWLKAWFRTSWKFVDSGKLLASINIRNWNRMTVSGTFDFHTFNVTSKGVISLDGSPMEWGIFKQEGRKSVLLRLRGGRDYWLQYAGNSRFEFVDQEGQVLGTTRFNYFQLVRSSFILGEINDDNIPPHQVAALSMLGAYLLYVSWRVAGVG